MIEQCVDQDTLDELVEIMGDDMQMLIDSYILDTRQKLEQFAVLDPNEDQEPILRLAHSLKGSSRNLGVITFANYCESIEDTARNGRLAASSIDLAKMNKLFEEAVLAIGKNLS